MTTLLAAALEYAAQGWPVFPIHSIQGGHCTCGKADCQHPAKHPSTMHGLKDATCRAEEICRWLAGNHRNVAIATGPISGLAVLDIDLDTGGFISLKALTDQHGPLPKTPTVHSGGGGMHLYFAYPADQEIGSRPLPNQPGLDTKGKGGSIVAPPSLHISGVRYAWQPDMGPETPLATVPDWLLALAKEAAKPLTTRKGEELHIPVGQRHDRLFRMGCQVRRMGLCEISISAYLDTLNDHHCEEPMTAQDIRLLAKDICKYPPGGVNLKGKEADEYLKGL